MKCDREKKPHEFKRVQRVLDALRGGAVSHGLLHLV